MPPNDTTTFDPSELEGVDRYKLLTGLVVPRPIGWIGTLGQDGRPNLAPFSFFTVVAGTPPTVLFSPGRRTGTPKDTLANALAKGEFTVNVVDEPLAEAMNLTSGEYAAEIDEFALAGLDARPGDVVDAPLVLEAPHTSWSSPIRRRIRWCSAKWFASTFAATFSTERESTRSVSERSGGWQAAPTPASSMATSRWTARTELSIGAGSRPEPNRETEHFGSERGRLELGRQQAVVRTTYDV